MLPDRNWVKQTQDDPALLLHELTQLRNTVDAEGRAIFEQWRPYIQRRAFRISALNLAHYIAFRRRDVRHLQTALMPWGLSSLGRSEARVLPNLDAVISTLFMVVHGHTSAAPPHPPLRAFVRGPRLLDRHALEVLGHPPAHRRVRIMVTLPTEAATDAHLVDSLVAKGMNLVRINCAHDDAGIWAQMIANLRQAEANHNQRCLVHMDLAGPKIRTREVIAPPKGRLFIGDHLYLTRGEFHSPELYPFQASTTLSLLFDYLKPGSPVSIDDGRLRCRVEALDANGALLQVEAGRLKGERLRPDKGLNFPDTLLPLSPLTPKDLDDLDFVTAHADTVGYSFVQEPADMDRLLVEISRRPRQLIAPLGIIAKIETQRAIQNLPDLIVHAAGRNPFGLMLARGDLAVELGYVRLAEMQEEILWLCEAAHIPIIWATQVLESLAKKGIPSRAEITDAAMGERAECVMLNKGPFIDQAVDLLDSVLTRMQAHQLKKTAQLRALRSW